MNYLIEIKMQHKTGYEKNTFTLVTGLPHQDPDNAKAAAIEYALYIECVYIGEYDAKTRTAYDGVDWEYSPGACTIIPDNAVKYITGLGIIPLKYQQDAIFWVPDD